MIPISDYQLKAVNELKNGSILRGGVGSGKSMTALAYIFTRVLNGKLKPEHKSPNTKIDVYVIATAAKRDKGDWENEAERFDLPITVDSWNNIGKFVNVKDSFFIFDEQKLIGSGSWVKSFYKIIKQNRWILLSATPGDNWIDYIPLFVANGFYKNRTEFIRRHVIYNSFTNFPQVKGYLEEDLLIKLRTSITVDMIYESAVLKHIEELPCSYNDTLMSRVVRDRWNPFTNLPIVNGSEYCYTMRKVVNNDMSRLYKVITLLNKHKRLIVFYNFDYELTTLRTLSDLLKIPVAEHNGHLHEDVPTSVSWIYLVQYASAAESWECITTNAIVLYSRNYSYKTTVQAMGRINRRNSPFANLYYYFLTSDSPIDAAIKRAYTAKENFNVRRFFASHN